VASLAGTISIRGARTHNLKNISLEIPRGKLTVVTGVSGSGKSSLVFDTLYAEGQRRYLQSLSTYARQFLEQVGRPDVDAIDNLPPALALRQKNTIKNARSTVGTVTDISDYLRLLFATLGETFCNQCGQKVRRDTVDSAAQEILANPGRWLLIASFDGTGRRAEDLTYLAQNGYHRLWLDGAIVDIEELLQRDHSVAEPLEVVVDRLLVKGPSGAARLREALERAFYLGSGRAKAVKLVEHGAQNHAPATVLSFSQTYGCARCDKLFPEPNPAMFSFNSPIGACSECQGFGRTVGIDPERVIPDPELTLRQGAVAPWRTPAYYEVGEWMVECARKAGVRLDVPYRELTPHEKAWLWDGETKARRHGVEPWFGIRGFFRWLERKRYKPHVRILLAKYRRFDLCNSCRGSRLKPEALNVLVHGQTIADVSRLSIDKLAEWLDTIETQGSSALRASTLLRQLKTRVGFLRGLGLGYLSLDRQARTLSGGETQRIHLASALGSGLTGVLYTLDEPTVGLHPRDVRRLLASLHALRDLGNTIVVVEHDQTVISGADYKVKLGPGAGRFGGHLVACSTNRKSRQTDRSKTIRVARAFLLRAIAHQKEVAKNTGSLRIVGARAHNLKNLTVTIPLRRLVCVTGVSGSGKSSLVYDVLYQNYLRSRGVPVDEVGECERIEGFEQLTDVHHLGQEIGLRSSRSNPATYLKIYDEIRRLFAQTDQARQFGLSSRDFSFNLPGGRCERCQGAGTVTVEMYFMGEVEIPCEVCAGKRFQERVLKVKYKGLNIHEVLKLTAEEACEFFAGHRSIVQKLNALTAVGLGYLELGQPTATLSEGEAQRLRIAAILSEGLKTRPKKPPDDCHTQLFIMDEPTNGLSSADVKVVMRTLRRLVAEGSSLLVIEHNLKFIAQADYIIDLGPGPGESGGKLVAAGSPLEICECPESYTGAELRNFFGLGRPSWATEGVLGGAQS